VEVIVFDNKIFVHIKKEMQHKVTQLFRKLIKCFTLTIII